MGEYAVLRDFQTGRWLRFCDPVATIEVHDRNEVLPALARIEQRVEQEKLFAAGFVSYEAAPSCDDALRTKPSGDFPLLYFALFASTEPIDLPDPVETAERPHWTTAETPTSFSAKVDTIKAAIARGETYQVNLTFPLRCDFPHDPWQLFISLVHDQPACGSGFLHAGRWTLCSASPELFFARDGERLVMRPMKGTAPRGRTLAEDRLRASELADSEKNRAENIMILDMVRNDLGRLAPPGTVRTEALCTLERYPTVWQLTSTVSAVSEARLAEVFQALFPCASITGAPKASTMRIIAGTESGPRRSYTGTLGWLAPDRQAQFNVAIRTVLVDRQTKQAVYGVGAGITWDSNGEEEYRECLDKAAVLFNPVGRFALIETLRWAPTSGYFLLPEHLARLQDSAEYFGFACAPQQVADHLNCLATGFPATPRRVRLLLHADGRIESASTAIEQPAKGPLRICLAKRPVDSGMISLYHKTTRRSLYDTARAESPEADEVVLWNERGELTECCTANLVIRRQGKFLTPPVDSGLLPGTYRAFLLQRGILQERVLLPDDLRRASEIYLVNAVRKWRRAVFREDRP